MARQQIHEKFFKTFVQSMATFTAEAGHSVAMGWNQLTFATPMC